MLKQLVNSPFRDLVLSMFNRPSAVPVYLSKYYHILLYLLGISNESIISYVLSSRILLLNGPLLLDKIDKIPVYVVGISDLATALALKPNQVEYSICIIWIQLPWCFMSCTLLNAAAVVIVSLLSKILLTEFYTLENELAHLGSE